MELCNKVQHFKIFYGIPITIIENILRTLRQPNPKDFSYILTIFLEDYRVSFLARGQAHMRDDHGPNSSYIPL